MQVTSGTTATQLCFIWQLKSMQIWESSKGVSYLKKKILLESTGREEEDCIGTGNVDSVIQTFQYSLTCINLTFVYKCPLDIIHNSC